MKDYFSRHKAFKVQLAVLLVELLALIILVVLGIILMLSNGAYWGVFVLIFILAAFFILGNVMGIRRMHVFMSTYNDYLEFKNAAIPLIDDMRSTQHDLGNQLQALQQAYSVEQGNSEIVSFYGTLNGNMKKLSMFLKTDKIIINALLANKYAEAKEKKIDLTVNCPNRKLECGIDDFALTSVLSNLIQNAIEISPEGSAVHLELTSEGEYTVIRISNPGSLNAKNPEDIFRLGYSSKSENRGIGLFSVRKIVATASGRIEVVQDSGVVTFSVFLPVH
jgi:sensor histidine kinase regulating citrate/malate metabolism